MTCLPCCSVHLISPFLQVPELVAAAVLRGDKALDAPDEEQQEDGTTRVRMLFQVSYVLLVNHLATRLA